MHTGKRRVNGTRGSDNVNQSPELTHPVNGSHNVFQLNMRLTKFRPAIEDSRLMTSLEEGAPLPKIRGVIYIFPREHEHPLILANRTDIEGQVGLCHSCRESCSGLTYSCSKHKLCTGRPDMIGSPVHQDPLVRDFCTGSRCSCSSSTYSNHTNFFKCLPCNFSLNEKCALALLPVPEHDLDAVSCQLCRSAMELIDKEKNDDDLCCSVCCGCCSDPTYSCTTCKFFLHESCSTGPSEILQLSQPFHPSKGLICAYSSAITVLKISIAHLATARSATLISISSVPSLCPGKNSKVENLYLWTSTVIL